MEYELHNGDCLEVMPKLPEEIFDSIVSDPPYGLSFMGKAWDLGVPGKPFWEAAYRVAKPGAYLVAFGGSRTFHRLAVGIEDGGWEIQDCGIWGYGSGFPKSMNVSKAIDSMDARYPMEDKYKFTEWVRGKGVTAKEIDIATNTHMGGHYVTSESQPAIMTREHLEMCRHLFDEVPSWIEDLCDIRTIESENMKKREVVGTREAVDFRVVSAAVAKTAQGVSEIAKREIQITLGATEQARKWEGWGTCLKPAYEPAVIARKPLKNGQGLKGKLPIHYGTESGFLYAPKANRNDREDGCESLTPIQREEFFKGIGASDSEDPPDRQGRNIHPTVKPTDLMRYFVRLVTPPGGLVLDPFMGSGSTGRAAMLEGNRFVGIELSEDYLKIANARIAQAKRTADYIKSLPVQMDLFDAMA